MKARASGSTTSPATCSTSGTLQRYIDELSVTGLTSNPTIFDHAIKNSATYDSAIVEKLARGNRRRGALLRAGAGGPHPRRRPLPADLRADQRRGRLGLARGLAAARLRRDEDLRGGQGALRARQPAQPLHQDPGHARGPPGDRGGDLRRRADQRHPALLARAVPRGRRGLPARHRAAHRRRPQPECRLGGLGVRQPLGRRGREQGARDPAQPARHRHRQAHLQGVRAPCSARRAGTGSTTSAPGRSGCSGPAPAPRIRRPPTFSTSRRWPRRSP